MLEASFIMDLGSSVVTLMKVTSKSHTWNRVSCERVKNKRSTDTCFGENEIEGDEGGS